jgi:hypothetical protein
MMSGSGMSAWSMSRSLMISSGYLPEKSLRRRHLEVGPELAPVLGGYLHSRVLASRVAYLLSGNNEVPHRLPVALPRYLLPEAQAQPAPLPEKGVEEAVAVVYIEEVTVGHLEGEARRGTVDGPPVHDLRVHGQVGAKVELGGLLVPQGEYFWPSWRVQKA